MSAVPIEDCFGHPDWDVGDLPLLPIIRLAPILLYCVHAMTYMGSIR